jgi:hypothetical protein
MVKLTYEKPLLVDLQKNEARIGYGRLCETGSRPNTGGGKCQDGMSVTGSQCLSGLSK